MLNVVRVVGLLGLVACGGGQQPVKVPPSHPPIAVAACATVELQSHWDNRSPVPASDVSASCANGKVCKASISKVRAAVVHAVGLTAGVTSLEIDFRDPVTHKMEHKAVQVTVTAPKDPAADPTQVNCDAND